MRQLIFILTKFYRDNRAAFNRQSFYYSLVATTTTHRRYTWPLLHLYTLNKKEVTSQFT